MSETVARHTAKPQLTREKDTICVTAAEGTRFVVVRSLDNDRWTTAIRGTTAGEVTVPAADRVVVTALDRTGRESEPAEAK